VEESGRTLLPERERGVADLHYVFRNWLSLNRQVLMASFGLLVFRFLYLSRSHPKQVGKSSVSFIPIVSQL
jgi:hypothetical protein